MCNSHSKIEALINIPTERNALGPNGFSTEFNQNSWAKHFKNEGREKKRLKKEGKEIEYDK